MGIPAFPSEFYVTQANRQIYLQWNVEAGATSYFVQRSIDGVNFSTISNPSATSYLDTAVSVGTQYWYQVASVNASGTSPYTAPQSAIPTPQGEMSLAQIRLSAQQRADRVNSQFVTKPEWNSYINQAMYELYDLLITSYEDYFVATPAQFTSLGGTTYLYPLPDGANSFIDPNGNAYVASPFYKLLGVDLGLNNANNAWVTVNKFNFIDRNRFVYPNTASSIYGVFNLQYRVMGNNIEFIPTPSAGQPLRIWYIPRLNELLKDTDITTTGISGWIEYVIVRAAIYALAKEESDVSNLEKQLVYLKQRIEESAINRDAGQPDKISDVRTNGVWGGGGYGWSGPTGGFALLPVFASNNHGNHILTHIIDKPQLLLAYIPLFILASYLFNLSKSKLGSRISFSFVSNFISHCTSALRSHISHIISMCSQKQMLGPNTLPVVAFMANKESIWNKTKSFFIRKSMCSSFFSVSKIKKAIASSFSTFNFTNPFPTTIGLVNSRPELNIIHNSIVSQNIKSCKQ